MSRSIRFHNYGAADVLKSEEVIVAAPAPDEVRVDVSAIGVSWRDVLWRQNLGMTKVRLPAGLGQDMAGVVSAVGSAVTDLKVGDKIASFESGSANQHPVYGEQILLPRSAVTRYPQRLTAEQASVHYTAFLQAYFAYVDLVRIKPGQTVLVTDADHNPGPAFIQLGKALGARVIAVTRNAERQGYLRSIGAAQVIGADKQALVGEVLRLTDGQGVAAIFDGLGGEQMGLLGDALAPRASLVLYGMGGGNQTPFPAVAAMSKNISFFVHCLSSFTGKPEMDIPQDSEAVARALSAINTLTEAGLLGLDVSARFAFDQVVAAHEHLETSAARGNVVLRLV